MYKPNNRGTSIRLDSWIEKYKMTNWLDTMLTGNRGKNTDFLCFRGCPIDVSKDSPENIGTERRIPWMKSKTLIHCINKGFKLVLRTLFTVDSSTQETFLFFINFFWWSRVRPLHTAQNLCPPMNGTDRILDTNLPKNTINSILKGRHQNFGER